MDISKHDMSNLIEEVCHQPEVVRQGWVVRSLHIVGFKNIQSLPDNIHKLFPNVRVIHIRSCPLFSSLYAVVAQFPHLEDIECKECKSLISLSSLSALPLESKLMSIDFESCGLKVTGGDDWSAGLQALARVEALTLPSIFQISIKKCPSLTCLPSSIVKLKDINRDKLWIVLQKNANLSKLPYSIGFVKKLNSLIIDGSPKLTQLPRTLIELHDDTTIVIRDARELNSKCKLGESRDIHFRHLKPYLSLSPETIQKSIRMLQPCILAWLYRPGGRYFAECQKSFEKSAKQLKEVREANQPTKKRDKVKLNRSKIVLSKNDECHPPLSKKQRIE